MPLISTVAGDFRRFIGDSDAFSGDYDCFSGDKRTFSGDYDCLRGGKHTFSGDSDCLTIDRHTFIIDYLGHTVCAFYPNIVTVSTRKKSFMIQLKREQMYLLKTIKQ